MFVPFGAMRAAASPDDGWGKRITIPLDRVLKTGTIIRGVYAYVCMRVHVKI